MVPVRSKYRTELNVCISEKDWRNFSLYVKEEEFSLKIGREELLEIFSNQCVFMRFPKSSYRRAPKVSQAPEKCKNLCKKCYEKAKISSQIEPKRLEVLQFFGKCLLQEKYLIRDSSTVLRKVISNPIRETRNYQISTPPKKKQLYKLSHPS